MFAQPERCMWHATPEEVKMARASMEKWITFAIKDNKEQWIELAKDAPEEEVIFSSTPGLKKTYNIYA